MPLVGDPSGNERDLKLIRDLELAGFRAWPALRTERMGGWLLRFANGHTKRANSVNVIEAGDAGGLGQRITRAEEHYERVGQPAIFRLSPLAEPELDGMLAERGYHAFDRSIVMTAASPQDLSKDPSVRLDDNPDELWFDEFCAYSRMSPDNRKNLRTMLGCIRNDVAYASVREDGNHVAFGMSVVEGERAGFFEIFVAPPWRGRGLGRRIMKTLITWSIVDMGARYAWLQVLANNESAVSLYRSLGFKPFYEYRYRMLKGPAVAT